MMNNYNNQPPLPPHTHHLRMELAGTNISEGFGVIWACDRAKEEVKLYKLSSIFWVNYSKQYLENEHQAKS